MKNYKQNLKVTQGNTSQRPKGPKFIPVSLAWSMPRIIATPPWMEYVHWGVTPQQYVAGTHLYTLVKRDKVDCSLSKEATLQQGLNPRSLDLEFGIVNCSTTHASTMASWIFMHKH